MDPLKISQALGVELDVVIQALANIEAGTVSWIVVSGKLCSGKDTIAPLIQPALGFDNNTRLGFGDVIRIEANQAIKIMREHRRDSDEALTRVISTELRMQPEHAAELVGLLRPTLRRSDRKHDLQEVLAKVIPSMRTKMSAKMDASDRSDLMRKILIKFGSDWRTTTDPDYWARQLAAMSIRKLAEGTSVYLTGGRFHPDVEIPQSAHALIIRLDITTETQLARLKSRDGLEPDWDAINHPSETALDEWPNFDVRVSNDGTLQEGLDAVVAAVKAVTAESKKGNK